MLICFALKEKAVCRFGKSRRKIFENSPAL